MKTQAVVFDLDGVIIDSEPLQQRAFNEFLQRHGVNYRLSDEEYGKFFVGLSVEENAKWLRTQLGMQVTPDQIRDEQDAIYTSLIANPANLVGMDGLYVLLDRLEACGVMRGLATGSPRHHVEMVLRGLQIDSCFRAVVTGSDISNPKPDPEIYLRVTEALRVEPRTAVALEDSAAGIASAQAAGLRVIAVPTQHTAYQDLSHADARVQSLEQVLDWLERF